MIFSQAMSACYQKELTEAQRIARLAGAFLKQHFLQNQQVDEEFAHDLKLAIDKQTQSLIERELQAAFPSHCILGEEGSAAGADATYEWIVDPLDGTVNYFYGLPLFCVSLALRVNGEVVLGCVYDPMQDECFTAVKGGSAQCNGRPLRVSERSEMRQAVVFIGHGRHDGSGEEGIRRFAHVSAQVRKIRILGTAALAISYIAAGRLDAYIENRIHLWDFAAAGFILKSAGGTLEFTPENEAGVTGAVIAWNGRLPIHEALDMKGV